uniref:Gag/pol polyprotein n=1 Tax=Solanum tuberosum TaxID=4113 RepID=M1BZX9_SOLTU
MGKLFRKIGEENKPIKSLEPVASLSVEGVNLDTKVLCVPGVSKGIEVRAGMPKLYVSKGFSLTQQDQFCLAKLKGPIFVKLVQQLPVTDLKAVPWNYNKITVVYRGKEIVEEVDEVGGLTRSGRCYSQEELRKGKMTQNIQVPLKKAVTEEEAEEFLKKIKVPDYSVVEQLKKTPAQISLLSLLLHSEEHRRVLNKILNEAHVSKETTVNQLEKMAKRIFESNTITFTDDELPTEGAGHNRALLLTVKYEGYYVKRVMIDGGSGVDICPLSTLQNLKISLDRGSGRPINSASSC